MLSGPYVVCCCFFYCLFFESVMSFNWSGLFGYFGALFVYYSIATVWLPPKEGMCLVYWIITTVSNFRCWFCIHRDKHLTSLNYVDKCFHGFSDSKLCSFWNAFTLMRIWNLTNHTAATHDNTWIGSSWLEKSTYWIWWGKICLRT